MMNKTNKKNYIEEMKKKFSSHNSVMIAQYQGLNVNVIIQLMLEQMINGACLNLIQLLIKISMHY